MIPKTIPTWQQLSWQEELNCLITDPSTLFSQLKLDESFLESAKKSAAAFPLRATMSYVKRIEPENIDDPLLKQILPIGLEMETVEGFVDDPLEELHTNKVKGLIHKYHGRVLLIAASQCAIHCRYCFRRHFDYSNNTPSRREWHEALQYIASDDSIEEVILSGGDPLALSDKQLQWLIQEIANISHVSRLRVHSRLPVVLPSRMTDHLMEILVSTPLHVVLVIHSNHAQELDTDVIESLVRVAKFNITLLNQTVLLRGVNDHAETLAALSKKLFSAKVLPYYLHLPDKVSATSHFDVSESQALSLYQNLLATLPGYLVPKLVKEVPNIPSKVPIN